MSSLRKILKNKFVPKEHLGLEETPQEIVKHGHYGFWLSPDGRCFVVNNMYGHGPIAAVVAEDYYGRYIANAEVFLEEHGWARVGGLPGRFSIFTDFIARGSYRSLEADQINTLFDLQRALPQGNVRHLVEQQVRESLEQIGMQMNPLDPEAWIAEKHRFDVLGEGSRIRLGVHTTPSLDLAIAYAVHKASQEGALEREPNCGIVLELDMSELTPMAEGDAVIAAKDEDILISELKRELFDFDVNNPESAEDIIDAIWRWSEDYLNSEYADVDLPKTWWAAYWEEVVMHHDIRKIVALIRDLAEFDPKRLMSVLRIVFSTGQFPLDLWAESIEQYRYMVPISYGRLLAVYAVRPVRDELADEDEDEDGDGPQIMSLDSLEPEITKLWDESRERQIGLWPKSRGRVEFHGTDVLRARASFPELADVIECPWGYGQPEGVGPL